MTANFPGDIFCTRTHIVLSRFGVSDTKPPSSCKLSAELRLAGSWECMQKYLVSTQYDWVMRFP